jgi:hypothetical protein
MGGVDGLLASIYLASLRLFSFSFSGCLQVTSVGINTEWGLLMASISEDTGEETPLQVFFSILFCVNVLYLIHYIYY